MTPAKPSSSASTARSDRNASPTGLYIVLISVHGLIRGENLELGRDADTGGQTLYVVQLARALARQPDVARVDLLTRRVVDSRVSDDYAQRTEELGDGAQIVRIDCGPRRYLRKERLWPHLDCFADNALAWLQQLAHETGLRASLVHGHYADAGYVAIQLANLLGVPMLHTGHSLGREKKRRLHDSGLDDATIEERFRIATRIHAEEEALANAHAVIASTQQEIDTQYAPYQNFHKARMHVLPPGTDISRFHPPPNGLLGERSRPPIAQAVFRFLREPKKPMILALSRADERKNIGALVEAYASSDWLRQHANLVIIAGNRDDLADLDRGARQVLTDLLLAIDRHDLYGRVAIPKHHQPDDVPDLYRMAAASRGVFVNPALTEPFGLTLLEAAASGLPIVATNDGGPQEIVARCENGLLVNPLDTDAIRDGIERVLKDRGEWRRFAERGLKGVRRHFTWDGHAAQYLKLVKPMVREVVREQKPQRISSDRLAHIPRAIITDIDNTLLGDPAATRQFTQWLRKNRDQVIFGVATGRTIDSAATILEENGVPTPDVWITSVGSEIHYGPEKVADAGWVQHLEHRWEPDRLAEVFDQVAGLKRQAATEQRRHKRSWTLVGKKTPDNEALENLLFRNDLHAHLIVSHQQYVDLLAIRAGKGLALRYVAAKWGIPLDDILVAGDSGNDEDMLRGRVRGVVVGNHQPELEHLKGFQRILFTEGRYAAGLLEGIHHFDILDKQV